MAAFYGDTRTIIVLLKNGLKVTADSLEFIIVIGGLEARQRLLRNDKVTLLE